MKLKILAGLILVLFIMPAALAANEFGKVIKGGKLIINSVDVKIDGKTDKNVGFGDVIRREAKPGSKVEFEVEIKNNFTREQDLKIEDIAATVTIEGIDDGDDLDEDATEFDLRAGRDDNVKVEFDIPQEVDEDTFDVLIDVDGRDENGTSHQVQFELDLEVKKEKHEVKFLQNSLSPSEIKCGRSVQLSTRVINTGSNDEDSVVLEVRNDILKANFKETFDLTNDAFDDDSKFRKTFTFVVPQDAAAGVYPIVSKLTYNEGKTIKAETAELSIVECELLKQPEEKKEEVKKDTEVVVVQPPVTQPALPTGKAIAEITSTPTTEEKPLFQTSGFLMALIAGEVLLIIIAVLIVVTAVRRRRE
ncbi:hypothetical protein HYX01_01090 [Candidatus Woesearchaeota archaeon]|nr:hypothetical protein [Candidatus Woesearchaeota archaeon]